VYLDPMFEETVIESDGIKGLKHFALYHDITDETIAEAKRVARKRVVLKDHFRSSRFEKHNFHVYKRKSAKFHFGVVDPC
ncbi:class I SAM-dependent methyltransferase, partial [Bacillus sp. D-CC]